MSGEDGRFNLNPNDWDRIEQAVSFYANSTLGDNRNPALLTTLSKVRHRKNRTRSTDFFEEARAERDRQVEIGFDKEHDKHHGVGHLSYIVATIKDNALHSSEGDHVDVAEARKYLVEAAATLGAWADLLEDSSE